MRTHLIGLKVNVELYYRHDKKTVNFYIIFIEVQNGDYGQE